MTKTVKIITGVLGTLAVVGGLVLMTPGARALADASGNLAPWRMMGQAGGQMAAMHSQMTALYGNDMGAMHQSMSGLMAEMPAIHNQVIAGLAARLNITPDQLQQALDSGKTLTALAEEQQVAPAALKAIMISTMQQALTDLVQAGKLDAKVAAQMRELIPQHAEVCLTTDMNGMLSMMNMMGGLGPAR